MLTDKQIASKLGLLGAKKINIENPLNHKLQIFYITDEERGKGTDYIVVPNKILYQGASYRSDMVFYSSPFFNGKLLILITSLNKLAMSSLDCINEHTEGVARIEMLCDKTGIPTLSYRSNARVFAYKIIGDILLIDIEDDANDPIAYSFRQAIDLKREETIARLYDPEDLLCDDYGDDDLGVILHNGTHIIIINYVTYHVRIFDSHGYCIFIGEVDSIDHLEGDASILREKSSLIVQTNNEDIYFDLDGNLRRVPK